MDEKREKLEKKLKYIEDQRLIKVENEKAKKLKEEEKLFQKELELKLIEDYKK